MSGKRKDNKGRLLRTGESQRKDLRYQYRYNDHFGIRRTVYALTLKELREKEEEIAKVEASGLDYSSGKISVYELCKKHISLKRGLKRTTISSKETTLRAIKREPIADKPIKQIKKSDAKQWIIDMHDNGKNYPSIYEIFVVVRAAFNMAVDEDILAKNPFAFTLNKIIPDDTKKREALTVQQQKVWMDFVKTDEISKKYYDEMVVLLGTGIRVSEMCGLTASDIDFDNDRIHINRQLRKANKEYYIESTKTESGKRIIPMSKEVRQSLINIMSKKRPKVEMIIEGYSNFIILGMTGNPKVCHTVDMGFRAVMDRFRSKYPDYSIPNVTPHVLRHTFCTNMVNAGMNVKSLQYLMGHANVSQTLDTYTHINIDNVESETQKIFSQYSL